MTYTGRIGQVVHRIIDGQLIKDWVAQVRIGDEQGVLVWGKAGKKFERYDSNDLWQEAPAHRDP